VLGGPGAAVMKKRATALTPQQVLRYATPGASRSTVRRHYLRQRSAEKLPIRCDNPACLFHTAELSWNGQPLLPILDHINGVACDNRAKNLRLLCPNCDAQLATRGGRNKGRVELSSGGFSTKRPDGLRDYVLPAESGSFTITQGKSPAAKRLRA